MKVNSIKTNRAASHGFTLIEMIGVLAVIAILAAMLLPKVFSAINDSRVNNAAVSVETIKTSATDHYGNPQPITGSVQPSVKHTEPASSAACSAAAPDSVFLRV